jgi:hypothetical protein
MNKFDVLKECYVEGNNVKLPDMVLDRKLYLDVAKSLNLIGGKWIGRKTQAFVFQTDPTELLESIQNGDKRNLKKEYQFFETPEELADTLVELAEIKESDDVLEPSAGQGSIVKSISKKYNLLVDCYELMDINRQILSKIDAANTVGDDFLKHDEEIKYDKIIANPPFSKNQDIDHIYKMFDCLKDNGILVSIASKHWKLSNNRKETQFRSFLEYNDAEIIDIESGMFKESGTMVGGYIIKIRK